MKVFCLLLILMASSVFASTLEEDYRELEPQMDMLSIQTSAVLNLLEPYIQKGNSVAAYLAASIHEKGRLVEKDDKKALELYIKASDKIPQAQMKVGNMYAFGHGTDVSFADAITYYEKVLASDDEKLKTEAAERIIILNDIIEKEKIIKEKEMLALSGDPVSMLDVVYLCLSIDNPICAYVWLSLSLKHPAFEQSTNELQNMLDRLSGEMTIPQIMTAEEELQKITQALKK
ncbi:MAG: sel1 repeat family protein [Alphaproteobacteria bacterium]|nr:sel1 repeat family protein [Alphaproteobacteria bacterium]